MLFSTAITTRIKGRISLSESNYSITRLPSFANFKSKDATGITSQSSCLIFESDSEPMRSGFACLVSKLGLGLSTLSLVKNFVRG